MTITAAQVVPPLNVGLAGFASILDFENALDEAFKNAPIDHPEIVIDFSECTFLEITTLQHLIALATARSRQNLVTRLRLPAGVDGKWARDFLRAWEFPKAIRKATKVPFAKIVVSEDLKYFSHFGGDAQSRRYRPRSPLSRAPAYQQLDAVSGASDSSGIYVSSRIVYEAMTNAVRHPGANIIQTASFLGRRANYDSDDTPNFFPFISWPVAQYSEKGRVSDEAADLWNDEPVISILNKHLSRKFESQQETVAHLTISFWDDGRSMIDTLRTAIRAGLKVREDDYPNNFDLDYLVRLVAADGTANDVVVSSAVTPTINTPDHLILLSTLFPGVTCDVTGQGLQVHSELKRAEPAMARQGMGLFSLLRTAIDEFGGSVAFRTDRYFMNVRKTQKKEGPAHYRAKIWCKPQSSPSLLGNMVTVRLPLQGQVPHDL